MKTNINDINNNNNTINLNQQRDFSRVNTSVSQKPASITRLAQEGIVSISPAQTVVDDKQALLKQLLEKKDKLNGFIDALTYLLKDLKNPAIPDEILSKSIEEHIPQYIRAQISLLEVPADTADGQIKQQLKKTAGNTPLSVLKDHAAQHNISPNDISEQKLRLYKEQIDQLEIPTGKIDLRQNPRCLLQLKNSSGKNMLEAYIEMQKSQCDLIEEAFQIHLSVDRTTSDTSIPTYLFSESTQRDLLDIYNRNYETDYSSLTQLIQDHPDFLLCDCGRQKCLAEIAVTQIENKLTTDFEFLPAYFFEMGIKNGDTLQICDEVKKLHQLQYFYSLLINLNMSKEYIFRIYENLDIEIKTAIGKSIWLACFKPDGFHSDVYIKEDPRRLLECVSKDKTDIVVQMMNYYKMKISMLRLKPKFEEFEIEFNKKDADRKQVLDAFPEITSDLAHNVSLRYDTKPPLPWPDILWEGTPSIIEQYKKLFSFEISEGVEEFAWDVYLPEKPVSCAPEQFADKSLLQDGTGLKVAMVTAELTGAANVGGLAPAVLGMAKNYGAQNVRVIMPKYDVLNPNLQLKEKEKYAISFKGKKYKVFKAKIQGIKCYFIEDLEHFIVGRNPDGKPNNIYNGKSDIEVLKRWAYFQSHAAELAYKFSTKAENPIQAVHCHDAQTALVPKLSLTRHFAEWKQGLTPATIFTFHNNNCPIIFEGHEALQILTEIDLPPQPLSSLHEGLVCSDMNTTVSKSFAEECQTALFGKGIEREVKIQAVKRKLIGVINGNSGGFDPQTDETLKNWRTIDGEIINLTYGPNDTDLPQKKRRIRKELVDYLKYHNLADIDPNRPIFFYVGRYDAYQKGIEKLPLLMDEALVMGAQFICIGVEPDEKADAILKEMEAKAKELGNKGVCIIRDYKRADGRLYWQQGRTNSDPSGVQGFGSLLRAAMDVGVAISKFEPFGFIQREHNMGGSPTLATATGGLKDTIFSEGPHRNGYLYDRLPDWDSKEQDELIKREIHRAGEEAEAKLKALYKKDDDSPELQKHIEFMKTMMNDAKQATWTSTFDGSLSPIEGIKLAYAKALQNRNNRGTIYIDLRTLRFA